MNIIEVKRGSSLVIGKLHYWVNPDDDGDYYNLGSDLQENKIVGMLRSSELFVVLGLATEEEASQYPTCAFVCKVLTAGGVVGWWWSGSPYPVYEVVP